MGLERWREMQVTVPLLSSSHTSLSFAWPNYPSVIWHNDLSPSLLKEWGCMMRSECDTPREWETASKRGENEIWSLSVRLDSPSCLSYPVSFHSAWSTRGGVGGGGHVRSYGPCFRPGGVSQMSGAAVPAASDLLWKLSSPHSLSVVTLTSFCFCIIPWFDVSTFSPPASAPPQKHLWLVLDQKQAANWLSWRC